MGATFSRVKNWIAEVLSYADLNAEIDNILTNFTPAGMDDMSANAAAMRLSTDPGEVGTESLAASLEQEIKRLRYVLQEIKGSDVDYWYESANVSLTTLRTAIGGALQTNRISSGAASSLSSAARFIVPNGSGASFIINGSPTSFAYVINDTAYSISTDATTSSIGTAPSSNNTCLVNDVLLTGQESSKNQGEDGSVITVDAMGSEISALVGKLATFKVVYNGNTEYFLGYIKSTTQITNCYRGFFYDSTLAQVPRIPIADNATITLHRTAWVFANTSQAIVLSYNNPVWSFTAPSTPNTGDYWYDMSVNYWKVYDSVTWQTANAILVGLVTLTSAACVGARSFEFFSLPEAANNMRLEYVSATVAQQADLNGVVGVGSNKIKFNLTRPTWDITANLETGYTEAASTTYYAYVTEAGKTILSPLKPYDFTGSLGGWYHPYEIWRSVGSIQNDGSSNLDQYSLVAYPQDIRNPKIYGATTVENIGLTASVSGSALTIKLHAADGSALHAGNPAYIAFRSATQATGTVVLRKLINNLSITAASGATLGHIDGLNQYLYVYLVDEAGVLDLAVSGVDLLDETLVASATQISAGATSGSVLYGASAHTSKAIRFIGRMYTNQTTAGTWASAPSSVSLGIKNTTQSWGDVKVWIKWDTTTSTVITKSKNVTSLTDHGTGETTITFTNSFSSSGYAVAFASNRAANIDATMTIISQAAGSVRVISGTGGGSAEDHSIQTMIASGDL